MKNKKRYLLLLLLLLVGLGSALFFLKGDRQADAARPYSILVTRSRYTNIAERCMTDLEQTGIRLYSVPKYSLSAGSWIDIQSGAFAEVEQASNHLAYLGSNGIKGVMISWHDYASNLTVPAEPGSNSYSYPARSSTLVPGSISDLVSLLPWDDSYTITRLKIVGMNKYEKSRSQEVIERTFINKKVLDNKVVDEEVVDKKVVGETIIEQVEETIETETEIRETEIEAEIAEEYFYIDQDMLPAGLAQSDLKQKSATVCAVEYSSLSAGQGIICLLIIPADDNDRLFNSLQKKADRKSEGQDMLVSNEVLSISGRIYEDKADGEDKSQSFLGRFSGTELILFARISGKADRQNFTEFLEIFGNSGGLNSYPEVADNLNLLPDRKSGMPRGLYLIFDLDTFAFRDDPGRSASDWVDMLQGVRTSEILIKNHGRFWILKSFQLPDTWSAAAVYRSYLSAMGISDSEEVVEAFKQKHIYLRQIEVGETSAWYIDKKRLDDTVQLVYRQGPCFIIGTALASYGSISIEKEFQEIAAALQL